MKVVIEPEITPHEPLLYDSSAVAESINGFSSLDETSCRFYEDRGYLLVRGGISTADVNAAKQTLSKMCFEEHPRCDSVYYEGMIRRQLAAVTAQSSEIDGSGSSEKLAMGYIAEDIPQLPPDLRARFVRKFMGFTHEYPALGAIARNRQLVAAAARLCGPPVREFQDMAMIKPPGGREKPWHQDHAYFNLPIETRIVGVWIALDRVTPDNGCMYLLAGAHNDGPRTHFMRRDWQICDAEMLGCRSVCAPMDAGDVLLFDAKLPHGTPTNRSNEHRWAIQLHYVPADVAEVDERVRLDVFGNEGKNVSC